MKRSLVLLALSLAPFSCGTTSDTCSPALCDGCCSADGVCNPGTEPSACGQGGFACSPCGASEACVLGACVATSGGGTGGGTTTNPGTGGGPTTNPGTGGGTTTNPGTGGSGSGTMSASGPTITAFTASGTLTNSGHITLSATVTDPDGVGDLSGGTLNLLDGTNLGPFAGAVGSYTFTLGWGGSLPASAINFASGGGTLQLEAKFYDRASAVSTRRLSLSMECLNPSNAACGGECVDVASNPRHCGRCNNPVAVGATCVGGSPSCSGTYCSGKCVLLTTDKENCGVCGNDCQAWADSHGIVQYPVCTAGKCRGGVSTSTRQTCAQVCAAKGATCTNTTSCSSSSSPYYTAAQYGGCASFVNGSRCGDPTPVTCTTLPAASTTYVGMTCPLFTLDCVCTQ